MFQDSKGNLVWLFSLQLGFPLMNRLQSQSKLYWHLSLKPHSRMQSLLKRESSSRSSKFNSGWIISLKYVLWTAITRGFEYLSRCFEILVHKTTFEFSTHYCAIKEGNPSAANRSLKWSSATEDMFQLYLGAMR